MAVLPLGMQYVLAGILTIPFGWLAYRLLYLHVVGISTTGTIIELVRDDSGEGPDTFTPVVAFTTAQGLAITAKNSLGTPEARSYFRVGAQVNIHYSAHNPRFFIIDGYDISLLVIVGFLTAGAIIFIFY